MRPSTRSATAPGRRFTLWFTGLSGSGKTTIAHLVGPALDERGALVEYLDGDTVRTHLSKGLGFSKEDRDTNIERIGWVASRLDAPRRRRDLRRDLAVRGDARKARGLVERARPVRRGLRQGVRRGVRAPRREGLYAKAFAGEIKGFTGVDDPYEEPDAAEIVVDTEAQTPEESARSSSSGSSSSASSRPGARMTAGFGAQSTRSGTHLRALAVPFRQGSRVVPTQGGGPR